MKPRPQSSSRCILRDRRLARLLAVTVLANLILFQAQTTLPLWIHRHGLPTVSYGLLLALNSGLLTALQLPAAKLTARWRPQPVIAVTSAVIRAGSDCSSSPGPARCSSWRSPSGRWGSWRNGRSPPPTPPAPPRPG
ncbi:MAG: hypothetical protein ACRDN0_31005 [Trebonia sp.]